MTIPSLAVQVAGQGVVTADQLNTHKQAANLVSDLRAFVGIGNMQVSIKGYTAIGDGGQGEFYWNSTSIATDDGGVTIVRPNAATIGAWVRIPYITNLQPGTDVSLEVSTSTGSTTSRTLSNRGADVFNVKDYGAKGDGTTDDSTAINAAIAAAHAAGGGTVFFPSSSGNYYTNVTPITLYGGVALKGSGRFATLLQGNTTTPASAVIITSSSGFDAEISDLQVQSWGNAGIYIKGIGRSHIHGVRVYHGNAGVGQSIVYDTNSVAGAYNHILDNCDLERGNIGVWVKSSAWALSVHDNKIISDNAIEIDGTGGGSVYENNLIQSYTAAPTGIGAVYTGASANDVWKGNYFNNYVDAFSFSSTNFGMELICNHYDTVTTKYVDHTSNGTAVSIEIDETGYVCIGGSKGGVGVQGAGQFGIIGNSANNAVGYRTGDLNTGGGFWSWLNGAKATGHMSLRNDTNGHYPIDVSGDNTVFLGNITVSNTTKWSAGTGTPSGALSGNKGDMFSRTDGAVGSTLYVCQGTTTWNAVAGV